MRPSSPVSYAGRGRATAMSFCGWLPVRRTRALAPWETIALICGWNILSKLRGR
jgi:hypothetical protein